MPPVDSFHPQGLAGTAFFIVMRLGLAFFGEGGKNIQPALAFFCADQLTVVLHQFPHAGTHFQGNLCSPLSLS